MKTGLRTRELLEGYVRAALVGVAGGLACLVFKHFAERAQVLAGFGSNVVSGARSLAATDPAHLVLVIAGGMVAAALVTKYLVPKTGGSGFADIMEAVSVKRGAISLSSAAARSVSSLAVVATGGSVGREGPIISLAAGAASWLTGVFRIPPRERAMLLGCGVAAGFASAYNAPIAGAIFALEVVIGNFAMELFAPVVVASVFSTIVTRWIAGEDPVYKIPEHAFRLGSLAEIVPYMLLGVASGFAAAGFQAAVRRAESLFSRVKLPRWAIMGGAGVVVGAIALAFPEICGNGYNAVEEIISGTSPRFAGTAWWEIAIVLCALAAVKTVGTALCVGAGASGGVFTPSLFVGAALGAAVGIVSGEFAPHSVGPYGGYALVGMGCLVAGTTRAPIMAVMVLVEMTRGYDIVLPLMLGCITSSLVARAVYAPSVYDEGLAARGRSAPQGIEETVLATTRVGDVMRTNPNWVARSTTYGEIIPLLTASRATTTYVCDDDRRYLGAIRVHDVIELAQMGDLGPGIIALDLATPAPSVTTEATLSAVFDAMEEHEADELAVVDAEKRLLGSVARRDVMSALHVEVLRKQNLRAKFVRRDDDGRHTDYVALPRGVELARVPLHADHAGRTLGDAAIRAKWRLTVLFIVRNDESGRELRVLPEAAMTLLPGDELIVLGEREDLARWRAETGAA